MATTMRFTPPHALEPADPLGGRNGVPVLPTPLVWVGADAGPWRRVRELALTAVAGAPPPHRRMAVEVCGGEER